MRIPRSTAYKLVINNVIVAQGSLKAMEKLRKKRGGHVYLTRREVGTKLSLRNK